MGCVFLMLYSYYKNVYIIKYENKNAFYEQKYYQPSACKMTSIKLHYQCVTYGESFFQIFRFLSPFIIDKSKQHLLA